VYGFSCSSFQIRGVIFNLPLNAPSLEEVVLSLIFLFILLLFNKYFEDMQSQQSIPLFDRIDILNSEDFENFVDNLNEEQSIFIIKIALEKAYTNGIYSLSESELLSKSLRLFSKTKKMEEKKTK
jgi:hypothetical protein